MDKKYCKYCKFDVNLTNQKDGAAFWLPGNSRCNKCQNAAVVRRQNERYNADPDYRARKLAKNAARAAERYATDPAQREHEIALTTKSKAKAKATFDPQAIPLDNHLWLDLESAAWIAFGNPLPPNVAKIRALIKQGKLDKAIDPSIRNIRERTRVKALQIYELRDKNKEAVK